MTKKEQVQLSDKEMAEVQRIAKQHGITEDEAATMIVSGELARRFKRRRPKISVTPIKRR